VCFVIRKTISELERVIFTTLFLPVQKTPSVGVPRRGICGVLFLFMFQWFHHRRSSSLLMVNACHAVASPSVKPLALEI
jgi:hypothetical protein